MMLEIANDLEILDLTILRLQDGSRAFVQCIIDNYSRYILAWKVSTDYGGLRTKELLTAAIIKAGSLGMTNIPNVIVDSGSENLNKNVDELVSSYHASHRSITRGRGSHPLKISRCPRKMLELLRE